MSSKHLGPTRCVLAALSIVLTFAACRPEPSRQAPEAGATPRRSGAPVGTAAAPRGCQPHIELHGGAYWAKELGRSEMWVLANHRINLWEHPGENRGTKVGEMRVGSRAVILEQTADAYRVRSPLDESVGWVSKIQVARTLHQDVETRTACTPE